MTRSPWQVVRLITAAALCATSVPASGQSLGDAARRAEEQRQQRPDASRSFTNDDLPDDGSAGNREAITLQLTMPLLQRYCNVRTGILRDMVKSPDLAQRMRAAIGNAGGTVAGLERQYASEPSVAATIQGGQMTTHEYVVTEVAFMAAVGILAGKLPAAAAPIGTIGVNVEFLKSHEPEIAAMWGEATSLQDQLMRQAVLPLPRPQ